ncbi:MAG: hypothetical protein R3Y58_14275, partial [Eubacteriales bacterium]
MGDYIVQISKRIVNVYVVLLFIFIWMTYYNNFAFQTLREFGGILSVVIYCALYQSFSDLFKGFKIGTYSIIEISFGQAVAITLSNGILYIEGCLIANRYISIVPILLTTVIQIVGCVVWATVAKQYFIHNIVAKRTLVIYGKEDVESYMEKLQNKYRHLFAIQKAISCKMDEKALFELIQQYDVIMLYEITEGYRTTIMKYCIGNYKEFYITPRIADITIQGFSNHYLIDTPLLKYEYEYHDKWFLFNKRLLDILVAIVGLLIGSVPMMVAAISIKIEDG